MVISSYLMQNSNVSIDPFLNFKEENQEFIIRNIIAYLNQNGNKKIYCEKIHRQIKNVMTTVLKNTNVNIIKQYLRNLCKLKRGKLIINNQEYMINTAKKDLKIGFRDNYSGKLNGYILLQTAYLEDKQHKKIRTTFYGSQNCKTNLDIHLYFENEKQTIDTSNFISWALDNSKFDLEALFPTIFVYSICTERELEYFCKLFIEIQIKNFVGDSNLQTNIIIESLSFYSKHFDVESIKYILNFFLKFLKDMFCERSFNNQAYKKYINLYDYISFIVYKDTFLNKTNINYDEMPNIDSFSQIEFENVSNFKILAIENCIKEFKRKTKFSLRRDLKIDFAEDFFYSVYDENLERHLLKMYDNLINLNKNRCAGLLESEIFHKYINTAIIRNVIPEDQIILIICHLQKINDLYENTRLAHGNTFLSDESISVLEYWLSKNIESICEEYLYIISIMCKGFNNNIKSFNNQVKSILKTLHIYIKKIANITVFNVQPNKEYIFEKYLIWLANSLQQKMQRFLKKKTKNCKKGIDKSKIKIFVCARRCAFQIFSLCEDYQIDIRLNRLNYLCFEQEEIKKNLRYYVSKIEKNRKNIQTCMKIIDTTLQKILYTKNSVANSICCAFFENISNVALESLDSDEMQELCEIFTKRKCDLDSGSSFSYSDPKSTVI
ncbi:hypothetical protein EDEG_02147 [Edhazardia aedis USNM 41457]|uniref:Uncharacterized protein n=1 Tax=Edhazardia aedis (strain USNM 41457) TaxID=1003232 RepID=J9D6X6_EDHAE|nr:hypothetical protein EDEG_02147 [Edhazardia aedis USNM 41457]|eukprot:EJW03526.1 hypothetical protein EDEG_02147 [Edhazardia aedis USNM 41457]